MSHIEGNKQETTALLSVLQTASSGSQQTLHFGKPSPALLSHQAMQSQRTDLAPPLGQARSKVSHQPCKFINRDKLGECAHYQVSLINSILIPKEVNTTQPKIKKVQKLKVQKLKLVLSQQLSLGFTKRDYSFINVCILRSLGLGKKNHK